MSEEWGIGERASWGGRRVRERAPGWGGGSDSGGDRSDSDRPGDRRHRGVPAGTCPDPFDDQDALLELEEEITTLAAHIHAAEHRFLELIADFDRRDGWKLGGHRNCADWLHFATGLSRGAARERVRAARALKRMPLTSEAMSRGELSFSKVRALTRVVDDLTAAAEEDSAALEGADPTREAELLEYARECTAAEVERLVRGWRITSAAGEAELERRRHASRYLSVSPQGDGMYTLRGRLDPEVGALLMRAIEAAGDALFREGEDWAPEGGARGPKTREVTPRQRRADALGLLAERAMAMGSGGGSDREDDLAQEEGQPGEEAASAPCECGGHREAPTSGTRAERYQVVLHVDEATLRGETTDEPDGTGPSERPVTGHAAPRSHLSDGTSVTAETSRWLSCDAGLVRAVRGRPEGPGSERPGKEGSVLDVGRRTRTIPPALRRALEIRDGGCRFPGCGLRFTDAHHISHWADGGETKLGNLVLLCGHHHRAVHEEGFQVRMDRDGRLRFFDRTGWPLPNARPPKRLARGAWERMIEAHRRRGLRPGPEDAGARFKRRPDIPGDLEDRAKDALDPPA